MFRNYVKGELCSNLMSMKTEDSYLYNKKRFKSKRSIANHEWVFDVDVETIINSTKGIMSMLGIDYTEEENLAEYNEQIDVDFD